MANKILFLTLRTFSSTGGIEKVSRIAGKALHDISLESPGDVVNIYSMYDETQEIDDKYFPAAIFSGFGTKKFQFVYQSIVTGINSQVVVLSHINLLLVGFLIKLFSPKTKLVLLVHGIEVWKSFPGWRKAMLRRCDRILPVSHFTKNKMIQLNQLPDEEFVVLNNCLDPFLHPPVKTEKEQHLLNRYGLQKDDIVLMALTRLSAKERYKGYDKVLQAMESLVKEYPKLKYLIVGKYDEVEKQRLEVMIDQFGLQHSIIFAGFIPDSELADHYNLADIYIMPSEKEGFGIVFIEAMFYGKPVIAGNKDGSVDALSNGELGLLVNPDNQAEIITAIKKVINNKEQFLPDYNLLMKKFSYPVYKDNFKAVIQNLLEQ